MDNLGIKDLAKYRLERAKVAVDSGEILYNHNDFGGATNRTYYSIFYALRAVLALEKIDFKRHKDVVAYFNKNYVSTEIFPKSMGRKIAQAKQIREDSDYDDEYVPSPEKTKVQIETAKELIKLVEKHIGEHHGPNN
jgi:uncharacterized protein (UPF0332 family)